ncbi:MAG: TSUP family transporter [Acidimicrobiales bacterium]|nr:TSUP family transporter [Actinomycetota bacterium]
MSLGTAVAAIAIEVLGATVQGVFGFGINLLAAPLLVLVDPHFAPAPVVLASLVGSAMIVVRERGSADRASIAWALGGRVPGTALGALVVLAAAGARLRPVVGLVVLAAVGLSLAGRSLARSPRNLLGVGAASGVMNMIAGLGGAPFGLVCRDMPGPVLRPTLAAYVLAGGTMSAAALALTGELGVESLRLTALLIPGVLVGFALSGLLVPLADRKAAARPGILLIATAGALAAIAKGPW